MPPDRMVTMQPVTQTPVPLAQKIFGSGWTWTLIIAAVVIFNVGRGLRSTMPEPLPVLGQVPEFELTDHWGRPFGSKDLRGRAWVANFIFTRCPTVCPMFTAKMGRIQHRSRGLLNQLHLVSFSVDPDYDTPERLAEYARKHRASARAWSFLTGPLGDIEPVVIGGLKVAMGRGDPGAHGLTEGDLGGIFHGSHFVLVDPQGRIRGYYDSNDADAVDRVLADAGQLLNQEPATAAPIVSEAR